MASQSLGNVTRALGGLEPTAISTSQAMAGVGAALTAVGVAGAAGFGAALSSAADFEKQMSAIKAVMSPQDVADFGGALETLALQLGKDTAFSAKEAAQGIEELVKAGVSAGDIMGGAAAASLNLAAAGAISVKDAAEIASNALNVFNLRGADMAHVADLIAGTANASAIDVNEFKFALSQSGAVAAAAGLSLDELAVAIGLMGNAGIKGSDAGTSLKVMLTNLVPSSKPAEAAFRALGIITDDLGNRFFDAEGHAKPLRERLEILKESVQGLSEKDRTELFHKAFGTDAMRAANVLANAGAEGFDTLAASMEGITAAQTAAERLNNLTGSMEQLKGSLETAAITIGQRFLPVATQLVNGLKEAVNWFLELPEPVQNTAVALAAVATAVGLIGGPLLVLVAALPAITAGFALIGPTLLAVLGPVGLVIAAIGLLTVAWVNDWGNIREHTAAFFAFMQEGFHGWQVAFELAGQIPGIFARKVGDAFDALGTRIHDTLSAIGEAIGGTFDRLGTTVQDALAAIVGAIGGAFDALGTTIHDAWQGYVDFITGTLDAIVSAVQTAWEGIPADIRESLGQIKENIEERWAGFVAFVGDRLSDLGTLVHDTWQTITDWIGDRLSDIGTAVHDTWQTVTDFIGARLTDIGTGITEAWTGFTSFIGDRAEAIRVAVAEKWQALTDLTATAWETIRNTIADWLTGAAGALTVVTTWIGNVLAAFGQFAVDGLAKMTEIGTAFVAGIQQGITEKWDTFKGWFGDRVRDLLNFIKSPAVLNIGSPSRVAAAEIGVPLGEGIIQGAAAKLEEDAHVVLDRVTALMNEANAIVARTAQITRGGGAAYPGGGLPAGGGAAAPPGTGLFGESTAGYTGTRQNALQGFASGAYPGSGLAAWRLSAPGLLPGQIYQNSPPGYGPILTQPTTTSLFNRLPGANPNQNSGVSPWGYVGNLLAEYLRLGIDTPEQLAARATQEAQYGAVTGDRAAPQYNVTIYHQGTSAAETEKAVTDAVRRLEWQAGYR